MVKTQKELNEELNALIEWVETEITARNRWILHLNVTGKSTQAIIYCGERMAYIETLKHLKAISAVPENR